MKSLIRDLTPILTDYSAGFVVICLSTFHGPQIGLGLVAIGIVLVGIQAAIAGKIRRRKEAT